MALRGFWRLIDWLWKSLLIFATITAIRNGWKAVWSPHPWSGLLRVAWSMAQPILFLGSMSILFALLLLMVTWMADREEAQRLRVPAPSFTEVWDHFCDKLRKDDE